MDKTVKTILVAGGTGFVGHHLANRLASQGHNVYVADIQTPQYKFVEGVNYAIGDLREQWFVESIFKIHFDEVYQLAADMGGAGYIFTGEHDADIIADNALINLNVLREAVKTKVGKIFFSSSACVYSDLDTKESNANPDSDYGREKLFSEYVYLAHARNYGINVKLGRFHNIFGPEGTWKGGKEKSPAAICRKVIENDTEIEIWGDGEQTRSFLYIDECLDAVQRLMESDFSGPVNIGSDEMVTINQLAELAMEFKGKKLVLKHIDGPLGVRGRTSDNALIQEKLNWKPIQPLKDGLLKTYTWIRTQIPKLQ